MAEMGSGDESDQIKNLQLLPAPAGTESPTPMLTNRRPDKLNLGDLDGYPGQSFAKTPAETSRTNRRLREYTHQHMLVTNEGVGRIDTQPSSRRESRQSKTFHRTSNSQIGEVSLKTAQLVYLGNLQPNPTTTKASETTQVKFPKIGGDNKSSTPANHRYSAYLSPQTQP